MKYTDSFIYKGLIINFVITDRKASWKTEDTATLQKYAAFMDIDLAGQPITPLQAAKITKLLIQQVVQSIDNIHQTAGQQA